MKKNYALLHFIILLWGFTPVLGKLISIRAYDLVWYRLLFSLISIFIYIRYKGISLRVGSTALLRMLGAGLIVGVHWYFFYEAIKVSNVSAALAGFSTITLFASLIQPLVLGRKFFVGDLLYGIAIAAGLMVVLNFESFYYKGIFFGILAAVTGAAFGIYNGKLILQNQASVIAFFEFSGAFVLMSVLKLFDTSHPFIAPLGAGDWIFLLVLSVLCTALAFTLSVEILKQFTPLTVIITNNLEPIYGIVFSVLIFGESEYMSRGFYIGTGIILMSIFTYPLIAARFKGQT